MLLFLEMRARRRTGGGSCRHFLSPPADVPCLNYTAPWGCSRARHTVCLSCPQALVAGRPRHDAAQQAAGYAALADAEAPPNAEEPDLGPPSPPSDDAPTHDQA